MRRPFKVCDGCVEATLGDNNRYITEIILRISAKVQIFQLAPFARIAPQDCLSRVCIDLTCKSFASGVNTP